MHRVTMTSATEPITVVSFPVEGMTCASCVSHITRSLRKVDGVESANVNLATELATVRFYPSMTDVTSLAHAVESAGYVVRVDQLEANRVSEEPSSADRHPAGFGRRLAAAVLLALPIRPGPWLRTRPRSARRD